MIRVAKFGGTSMGSSDALWNAAEILANDPASRLVVVSATSGTTNQLLAFTEAELGGERAAGDRILGEIRLRHQSLASQVGVEVAAFPALFRELEELQYVLRDAAAAARHQEALGLPIALLVPDRMRLPLARLLRRALPQLRVIAHAEIPDSRTVRVSSILGART